jgi:hypothetical protein
MAQSADQLQAARTLAAEYGLTGADFYQHRQSQSFLISRTGIEKIQYKAGIEVSFDAEKIEAEFAAVKATATRKVKVGEAKTATKLTIQTFGSASKLNCQVSYYLEMAEKRALSRAVLKLSDFYQLGVYGEDELPPASFRADETATTPAAPAPVGNAPAAQPQPVMRAVSSSAAPVASTGSDQSTSQVAGPAVIPAEILTKLTRQFEAATSGIDVKKLWDSLTGNEKKALFDVKEAAKARVADAAQTAATVVARQQPAAMKDAGTDASLVAEFVEQPAVVGVEFVPATNEQRESITRLLDYPAITRKEKTYLLLGINKLDKERARQAIIKLREAIEQRTGTSGEQARGMRELLHKQLNEYGKVLGEEIVAEYSLLVENADATTEQLRLALDEVRQVLPNPSPAPLL